MNLPPLSDNLSHMAFPIRYLISISETLMISRLPSDLRPVYSPLSFMMRVSTMALEGIELISSSEFGAKTAPISVPVSNSLDLRSWFLARLDLPYGQ